MSTSNVNEAPVPSESEQDIENLNSTFCASCRNFCVLPEQWPGPVRVAYTLGGITKAAKRNCQLCCRFVGYLDSRHGTEDLAGSAVFHAVLNCVGDPWYDTSYHSRLDSIIFPDEWTYSKPRGGSLELVIAEYTIIDGITFVHQAHGHNKPYPARVTTALTAWTGDEAHLRTINRWIQNCEETHSVCRLEKSQKAGAFIPTRLINVAAPNLPYLTTGARVSDQKDSRYITLSHRWQNKYMPKLLVSNLHEFLEAIQIDTLPAVFVDAIDMCRRLGVPFLWIDALCLIQDDAADCDLEIASMGEIYANAFINIGATGASDRPGSGLYTKLNPVGRTPLYMKFQQGTEIFSRILHEPSATNRINQSDLMSRGWVFQERLLSPRSIYMDDLLGWECAKLVATEVYPEGRIRLGSDEVWDYDLPFKVPSLLRSDALDTASGGVDYYLRWLDLAQSFSTCQLTYDEDALPAISGLARAFQNKLQDQYVAGLWYKDIVRGLLWSTNGEISIQLKPLPTAYRAPSWSWLSQKERVLFMWNMPGAGNISKQSLAHVHELHIEHTQNDGFGRISSGYLRISCHIRKASDRRVILGRSWFSHRALPHHWYEKFDDGRETLAGCWFSVLQFLEAYRNEVLWEPANLVGIILEPVNLSQRLFRKVGVFAHVWGEHAKSWDLCPEFADVARLEDMEQEEVTII